MKGKEGRPQAKEAEREKFLKSLPSSIEAERFVLGGIIRGNKNIEKVMARISSEDFALRKHQLIFAAMVTLYSRKDEISHLTLANEIQNRGQIEVVEGLSYIASLDEGLPDVCNLENYAAIVHEKSVLRRTAIRANALLEGAMSPVSDAKQFVSAAERDLGDLAHELEAGRSASSLTPGEFFEQHPGGIKAFLEPNRVAPGIPTGFDRLDELMHNLQLGNVYIIGGETRSGKSTLALNIADNLATNEVGVYYASLEMGRESLLHRILCRRAKVRYSDFRKGIMTEDERKRCEEATRAMKSLPLYIDDQSRMTVSEFMRRLRLHVLDYGVRIAVIDYVQIMDLSMSGDGRRFEREYDALGYISTALRDAVKTLGVSLIEVCQLSRAGKSRPRGDRKPQLSDVHGSSQLEKDASHAILIYREELDSPSKPELRGVAELLLRKNRFGSEATIKMRFNGAMSYFEEVVEAAPMDDD